jgi:hypothetical protein
LRVSDIAGRLAFENVGSDGSQALSDKSSIERVGYQLILFNDGVAGQRFAPPREARTLASSGFVDAVL